MRQIQLKFRYIETDINTFRMALEGLTKVFEKRLDTGGVRFVSDAGGAVWMYYNPKSWDGELTLEQTAHLNFLCKTGVFSDWRTI